MIDRILRITCQKASSFNDGRKYKVMTATAKDYIARYFLASSTPVQDTDIETMMWQDYQDHLHRESKAGPFDKLDARLAAMVEAHARELASIPAVDLEALRRGLK